MTTVLKLGGSLITKKGQPETLDDAALDRTIDAIASANVSELVLVHGGGSFGHHHANEHGVSITRGTRDPAAALDIHDAMKTLDTVVLARLQDRGVPALPVHPLSAARRGPNGNLSLSTGAVETMLAEGFVPVLHGDVVAHAGKGATVVSGDELVVSLATALSADRVGLCSTVPGVLDAEGNVIPEVRVFDDAADVLGGSDATDVTGGMAEKVRTLLELDVPAAIFGLDELEAFLNGERAGTYIDG